MSEADLLNRAAAHAHAAAVLAAALAGVDTEALDTEALDTEVAAMGDACEAAMHSWRPPEGWHW